MDIYCLNTETGLTPLYPSDIDEKKKLKLGQVYRGSFVKDRSYLFLKKFMALIKIGHQNTTSFIDITPFDVYRKWAIIKAGFYETYHTKKGIMVEAKSISFGSMSEEKFQELYNKVIDVIIKDIAVDKKTIEDQLLDFM